MEAKNLNYKNPTDYFSDENDNAFTRKAFKRSIKYYLQNTTLHGLKYIAEDKITIPERVFFGISFIGVVVLSSIFISNIYDKWNATPIIISTSAKQTSSTEVPFPAITICNLNQAQRGKVQLISSFGSQTENCSMIFNSVLTDDGLCCTFNALDTKFLLRNFSEDNLLMPVKETQYQPIDWSPENGYPNKLPRYYYPRVSGGTGVRMGLTVVLNVSSEEYYCSKSKCVGFKILVHNPAELPKISNYGFLMTAGREARIPIEPIYQDAVTSIRSIGKTIRRCLFSDEGDLIYYRTYSRKNCELECEAKIFMQRCSCVLYYLPRFNPDVPICGPRDNFCTNKVQSEIESSNKNVSCDSCLPGCFELTYQATLTASTMIVGNFKTSDDFPPEAFDTSDDKINDLSIMHFYYTSNIFRSTTKSEMFGFTEFLSNTGGLLGLFMGFSIFSIIEILYYITVRPYCAIEIDKKHKKKREKCFVKASIKNGSSSYKIHKTNWFKKAKKSNKILYIKSRNICKTPTNLQTEYLQTYPYIE